MQQLRVKFDRHGLGDCVHFAHALQLYKRRGYDITVQVEENKLFVWKVAGVNIVQGGDLPDHSYLYPSAFHDLTANDHDQNKVAFGLRHDVMPPLGEIGLTPESAWEELCDIRLSAHDLISPEAHAEAEHFLEGLPRPIICLHSRGTNWHERKSLPTETAFEVILKLLDQTSGSVIVLDYDRRAPMVGDPRCKGIKPAWGHIGIDRLCALYERSDLMIGVDSGPFHVASLTGIKALGVFRSLLPTRVCLPNPNAVYLTNAQYGDSWIELKSHWNIRMYAQQEPSAHDIVSTATAMLSNTDPPISGLDLRSTMKSISGKYIYRRISYDERTMQLLPDGRIGEGAAGCEQRWNVRIDGESRIIEISGKDGIICSCRENGGAYYGRWTQFEQMPVELIPILHEINLGDNPRGLFSTRFTTARDFRTDWFMQWKDNLSLGDRIHRKSWEVATVCETLRSFGALSPNMRGVGFGVGSESLPAVFAKLGCSILATDTLSENWSNTTHRFLEANQFPGIATRLVDMNWIQGSDKFGAIEENLFDFSWSVCSMDHCGSAWLTKRFLLNQMNCLKRGGIAAHTAEYTINVGMAKYGNTVWFTWDDIVDIENLLRSLGHRLAPIDWFMGDSIEDHIIDVGPYVGHVHIKCEALGHWGTCVLFAARKETDNVFWVPVDETEAREAISQIQRSHSQT